MADSLPVSFSLRSQHKLTLTVVRSTSAATGLTTFTWYGTVNTSGNTQVPYGTGSFNMATSSGTTYLDGSTNNSTSIAYDYRSPNQNRVLNIPQGRRTAPANGANYTWTLTVNLGSLIGSATATLDVAAGSLVAAPGAPTYLGASYSNPNGIDLYWGGATGTVDSYAVYWASSASATPNIDDFTTTNTSYSATAGDLGASQGDYRYFWVRAKNTGGYSPWYPSGNGIQGQVAYPSRTATFYYNDGSGGSTSRTATSENSYITTTPTPSRSGYNFSGWFDSTSGGSVVVGGAVSYTIPFDGKSLYAQWTQAVVTPSWTTEGQVVNPIATLGLAYKATDGSTESVSATNGSTYTVYSGSLPNGLTLASNGQITGTPKAQGIFNFVIRATSITGHTTDSGTIQIVSYPPGYRLTTDAGAKVQFTTAKRYVGPNLNTTNLDGQVVTADAYGYTPLTMMKRFIGIGQPGADANGWINIVNKI